MCGIVGSLSVSGYVKEGNINSSLERMKNRGPNDKGVQIFKQKNNEELILGHTRLSIIDLSNAGHQPMQSSCKRYTTVFNGEIYNFKELKEELVLKGHNFATNSDTEVLLTAWSEWGKDSLNFLDGMFAFVIYDKKKNSLICVRDGFGIKPFFYSVDDNSLFFSSDIHALHELSQKPKRVCYEKAYEYLIHGRYDNDELTFIENVKHLRPGYVLEYDCSEKKISEIYKWYIPNVIERDDLSFDQASELIRETFIQNVRLQLRSDVPLGAALSGGLDSSAVVCTMRYLEPNEQINTFSYIAKGSSVSEEKWVDYVNDYTNSVGYKVEASGKDLLKDLDDLIKCQGEPFMSTSIYAQYKVFKLAKSKGITVTLDGQGADELLAGYRGYPVQRIQSLIDKKDLRGLTKFMFEWPNWPGRSFSESIKFLTAAFVPKKLISLSEDFHVSYNPPDWLNKDMLMKYSVNNNYFEKSLKGRNVISRLADSLQGNGLPQLLRHADRNSMNFSIESRVPFLTIPFADLALSLPEDFLISNNGETKSIFRSAMRGIVPDKILDRKDKIGFATPEEQWLVSILPNLNEWLKVETSISILNNNAVIEEFNKVLNGKKKFTWQIWRLINFIRWCQIFDIDA